MTLRDIESFYSSLTPARGDEFLSLIREASLSPDINSLQLMGILERYVREFRPEGRRICLEGTAMSQEDRDMLTLQGRIVAALLLVLHKTRSYESLRENTLLFLSYASAVVRTKYDYQTTALDVVCYRISFPGLDWHEVQEITSLDLLSYRLIRGIRFDRKTPSAFSFQGRGQVECQEGRLSVSSTGSIASGARAFGICGDRVGVYTRNVRDEKLKSTEQYNAVALRDFSDTFLRVQEEGTRKGTVRHEYSSGETVDIQVLGFTADGESLQCRVVDKDADVRGPLIDEELIKGVWTRDLWEYFCDEDCIRGAVLYHDGKGTASP